MPAWGPQAQRSSWSTWMVEQSTLVRHTCKTHPHVIRRLRLVGNAASHDSRLDLPPREELLDLVSSLKREMLSCSRSISQASHSNQQN